ncbi:hypothetical protein I316_06222 [Kwoniella heveanensis BCC8398]|uniref:Cation/H+ exchanger transmembrane domain-containing protein n=1 Tax=Kwoniella heveanensis BCC8398 TaxID=1296120 RepID=A0A1B9GM25_9TREE|nr:hypothetical protein I316_06222 [Kwoniella heveanensis BCC8398]
MWSSFTYHEPSIPALLILSSWIYLLNLFGWISQHLLSAQLLGQILIGIIFGTPLAGWLEESWQDAFVAVGYVGLLLIVFEGGLSSSFANVVALLPLSMCIAVTGILTPIGLSFILIPLAGFSPLHAFAAGAALSSTSLGTSLSVLNPASLGFDLRQTKLGTALLSAAVMDDVVAFVLASILGTIGEGSGTGGSSIGKGVGRTIGVTIGLGVIVIPITRYFLRPLYARLQTSRKWRDAGWGGQPMLIGLMACGFIAMIAASGYAGTSPLYGAYVAGLACAYLSDSVEAIPSVDEVELVKTTECRENTDLGLRRFNTLPAPSTIRQRTPVSYPSSLDSTIVTPAGINPTLRSSFEHYLTPLLHYLLVPIFFGSIGYCIPFVPLWRGPVIWRGIIYALLMVLGKILCGIWLMFWPSGSGNARASGQDGGRGGSSWKGAIFLGSAMVARGEIGLLISQIAYNTPDPLLTEDEFLIVNWGIILATIGGPVGVGWIVKRFGKGIMDGGWS